MKKIRRISKGLSYLLALIISSVFSFMGKPTSGWAQGRKDAPKSTTTQSSTTSRTQPAPSRAQEMLPEERFSYDPSTNQTTIRDAMGIANLIATFPAYLHPPTPGEEEIVESLMQSVPINADATAEDLKIMENISAKLAQGAALTNLEMVAARFFILHKLGTDAIS